MATTRRDFVKQAASAGMMLGMAAAARGESLAPGLASDPLRPRFHLLPAKNWMNDPNGPIFQRGLYHLFFQYNPEAAVWGNMSWNHATSRDMLHWTLRPLALTMTPGGPDAAGVFSGSCVAVGDRVYAFYTGVVRDKPHETIRNEGLRETQCMAWSDDPLLKQWVKRPEPVIAAPPAGVAVTGFRDPSVWKSGQQYLMTVGSGITKQGGCVLLYGSTDLESWRYLHPLTSGTWNGKYTANPVDDGEMWECPDFFALDGGHVLIYSTEGKVCWQSGVFDESTLRFTAKKDGLLDLDAFYAPKTQLDAKGRRILWGWIPERRSEAAMREAGWSGMMSLPREMKLDADGTLRLQILPDTTSLRAGKMSDLEGRSGEVLCSGVKGRDFRCLLPGLDVRYDGKAHTFAVDGKVVQLQPQDVPEIHAFVDGSVVEATLGQRVGCTRRFYAEAAVKVKVEGAAKLQVWRVESISPDRLTSEPA